MKTSSFRHQNRESSNGSTRSLRARPPPPPPNLQQDASSYSQRIATSMTIEEMRQLHQRALRDAEAKQTELRLVLASRYRELVGSSDEVILMKQRAQEMHELVGNFPALMENLSTKFESNVIEADESEEGDSLRQQLSQLPRLVHRALDVEEVHDATSHLIALFTLISSHTDEYPLANALSTSKFTGKQLENDLVQAQMRMTYLQMQAVPRKVRRISEEILVAPASYHGIKPLDGARRSAAALSSLFQLGFYHSGNALVDAYFDSKGRLLRQLLDRLQGATHNAEEVLSHIVLLLQHDVMVHPYEIFVLQRFPGMSLDESLKWRLPTFDSKAVRERCSKFLQAHLPLIRSKVKMVLVDIAGTTASALGQIRQSLYDKTDGQECMHKLNENDVCTWDEAVQSMVDGRIALEASGRTFSLWGILFSNTFSSLVHSLLTTSFQSVHSSVVATLKASLANAPPLESLQPHDAYRNMLRIATDLDKALLNVANDAHELLVHAEEREESERRLRQSLYVQTCEIMGRLLCQLRSMVSSSEDARKELIIGRLCHLLKFRLASLPRLLDASAMNGVTGMILHLDIKSAFDLADDNNDGLITFAEATQAVESAFSGTNFRGAEMLRETLLLADSAEGQATESTHNAPLDVSLDELSLLASRGVRHDKQGSSSALGSVQSSLDGIIRRCFKLWAKSALSVHDRALKANIQRYHADAMGLSLAEWSRLYGDAPSSVSPSLSSYALGVATVFGNCTCPSDFWRPAPSQEYATSMGLGPLITITTMKEVLREALVSRAIDEVCSVYRATIGSEHAKYKSNATIASQLAVDIFFVKEHMVPSIDGRTSKSLSQLAQLLPSNQTPTYESCCASTLATSGLLLSSLLARSSAGSAGEGSTLDSTDSTELRKGPLPSSRRFPLLPVQSDKSLADLQLRGQRADRDKKTKEQVTSGNVVSSGLGFLSSMLKKK